MDTHNTDRSQSSYVNEKSQPKRVYTVCFHFYKSVKMQTYSDRKQVSGCLGMEGWGALIFMFIAVMVLQVNTWSKWIKLYTLNICNLVYFNYALIRLLF